MHPVRAEWRTICFIGPLQPSSLSHTHTRAHIPCPALGHPNNTLALQYATLAMLSRLWEDGRSGRISLCIVAKEVKKRKGRKKKMRTKTILMLVSWWKKQQEWWQCMTFSTFRPKITEYFFLVQLEKTDKGNNQKPLPSVQYSHLVI